ncbi:hypothetical protein I4U23_005478 [Adineta vaga]|nr:hypothetical protein I4U23_005478 [Adineta vaga]
MEVPTVRIKQKDLQNFVSFVYQHEQQLNRFGAIKIQLNNDCKLALRKRKKTMSSLITKQIIKKNKEEPIYIVQKMTDYDEIISQSSSAIDESTFWSSLSCINSKEQRSTNSSILHNKSYFLQKMSSSHFNLNRIPQQSLLKLGGKKVTSLFVPHIRRSHGPGAIFPLTSTPHYLFSVDYHHEGGVHHWYIIPAHKRETLRRALSQENYSVCLEHGQILVDPLVLDKHHIPYYRVIQQPNEFVVLSAGTLTQSFAEDSSWHESVAFALPSWVVEGHAYASIPPCHCHASQEYLLQAINMDLFRPEHIQKYITSHLSSIVIDNLLTSKDFYGRDEVTKKTPHGTETKLLNVPTLTPTFMTPIVRLQPIVTNLESSPTTLTTSLHSNFYCTEDKKKAADDSSQSQCETLNLQCLECDNVSSMTAFPCVPDTTTDQYLMDTDPSSMASVENEKAILDYLSQLSSTSAESYSFSEAFDYSSDVTLSSSSSSSSFLAFSKLQLENVEEPSMNDTARTFSQSSQASMSKTLFIRVSQIPSSVSQNQLEQLFPQSTSIKYRQGKTTRDRVGLGYENIFADAQAVAWFVEMNYAIPNFFNNIKESNWGTQTLHMRTHN